MDKDFEEWFDSQDDNYELSFDLKSFHQCWKASRIKLLEELLALPEDEEMVGFIDRMDLQKKLKEIKKEG